MDMATVVEKTKVSMGATYGATFGKDRWEQKNSGDKTFIVKEVYASLKKEGEVDTCKFFNLIWKLPIPSKVKGLVWKGTHNRIQTR